jgi:hypothetical protein
MEHDLTGRLIPVVRVQLLHVDHLDDLAHPPSGTRAGTRVNR